MSQSIVISGTGLFTPPNSISNDELVASFNAYVDQYNQTHQAAIDAGERQALSHSSSEFIEKASGIKSRYVMDKDGVLDIHRMRPSLRKRSNDEHGIQCEMALQAIEEALKQANKTAADIDAVIVACANPQRAYPAVAIEIQTALGASGFAYDLNVACSSATFGIQAAYSALVANTARCVLVVNPEICSGHLNWCDRDSHFIFGDVCTAIVLEHADTAASDHQFEILDTELQTQMSNNIRNNAGFLSRCEVTDDYQHPTEPTPHTDQLFVQNGRRVFKDVCPMVATQISKQLEKLSFNPEQLKRMWLHQANINMNTLIAKRVLGREASEEENPTILDTYANTSSAGSIIAFHLHRDDIQTGDVGVICSFGAGYSIGSILIRKR